MGSRRSRFIRIFAAGPHGRDNKSVLSDRTFNSHAVPQSLSSEVPFHIHVSFVSIVLYSDGCSNEMETLTLVFDTDGVDTKASQCSVFDELRFNRMQSSFYGMTSAIEQMREHFILFQVQ